MGNHHVKRERKSVYDDVIKLYGWSMSQDLPTRDLRAIEVTKRIERVLLKNIIRTPDNNKCGYVLECDLETHPIYIEKNTSVFFQMEKQLKSNFSHFI